VSDFHGRVLITTDAVGGVWQYTLDLARALGARGAETVLAVLGPSPAADQLVDARGVQGATLVDTGLALDWLSDGPAPVLAAGAAVAALARETGAELIQLNNPALGAAAPPGVPVVAVTHGCVASWWQAAKPGEALSPEFQWHRALMGEGLRAADAVAAPTASYARTVARLYGLRQTPAVVHNGRTPLVAAPGAMLVDRALTVGRLWDQVKRTDLLDRVAARLSVPFDAAGAVEGPHGERAEVANLNLLGRIGADALAERLAGRPVFVSAASFEPFGLAVLEAASAGCALVLSDIASFRELWDGAALFVTGDDEAAYAEAVEALIGDPARRAALGEAAQARAARYTVDAMAEGMAAIYAKALGARLPGGRVAA
jgi:glycosyltransferase involved in cell wall biosynthesis